MKIAYIGKIQLSDTDLSYLNSAQKIEDITYIMEITPRFLTGPAYNVKKIYPHTGVFKAIEAYPEFEKYSKVIDVDKFYVVNTCGRLWQLKAFWTNFLLFLFLLRGHFDVVHLTWPANIYEFIVYWFRKRMILTVHDPFPHSGLDTRIVRLRRKVAFSLVSRFMILNNTQRQRFIDYYKLQPSSVVDSRLSCFPYMKMTEPDLGNLPACNRYILFAGRISKYKGVKYLFEAMTNVHLEYPEVRLVVAGSGKFDFDIGKYEKMPYIEIRNRFIPDSELVALIKHSEFMVCPYTDATQSGVVMSAFTFGLPVLATRVGGLPEMLGDGRFGLLVKEKSVDALAAGISELLGNKDMLRTFHENIENAYSGDGELSWMTIAKDLKNTYMEMAHECDSKRR